MNESMYEVLMSLPVFKGVSYSTITEIVGRVKFHFVKFDEGAAIASAGQACTGLMCVVSGRARLAVESADGRLRALQTVTAPDLIAPDFLFGRNTLYPMTARAWEGPCGVLLISKADYLNMLRHDEIFLFNFLNLLSKDAQKPLEGVLALTCGSLEERIAFWVVALTQPGSTDVVIECRHKDLYSMFGVPRAVFFQVLDAMKGKGLLDYESNRITVNSRRDMLDILGIRR